MAIDKMVRKKLPAKVVVVIILIIASLLGIEIAPKQEGKLVVTMFDVGQADCFLLEQGGNVALIDCGTASGGKEVAKALIEKGIKRIDLLIGSHPHDDHLGGMQEILENFEIGVIVIPEVTKMKITTPWYVRLMKAIKDGQYKVQHPKVNDIYLLGAAQITVLGPLEEPEKEKNNYSTVLKVSFGTNDIVFTGDAEIAVEKAILEVGADVSAEILKLGHHGSYTSTSDAFLDAVDPKYALVSAGLGNSYNHPVESVMDKLEERGIEVYRTDECGTVIVTITGDDIVFSTKPGDYLSGEELEARESK